MAHPTISKDQVGEGMEEACGYKYGHWSWGGVGVANFSGKIYLISGTSMNAASLLAEFKKQEVFRQSKQSHQTKDSGYWRRGLVMQAAQNKATRLVKQT